MNRRPVQVLLVSAMSLLCLQRASAQVGLELHAGPSLPSGEYGASSRSNFPGSATTGFYVASTLAFATPSARALEWTATSGVAVHSAQPGIALRVQYLARGEASAGSYVIIPLLVGARLRTPVAERPSVHFGLQLGLYLLRGPPTEVGDARATFNFIAAGGVSFEAGIDFGTLGAGVRLTPLGEQDLARADGGTFTQPVSYLDVFITARLL